MSPSSIDDADGRPYLHIHPTYTERPIQIINLSKANITPSPDVEALLGVRHLPSEEGDELISSIDSHLRYLRLITLMSSKLLIRGN